MTASLRIILIAVGAVILAGCQNLSQQGTAGTTCTTVAPCNGNTVGNSASSTGYVQNGAVNANNTIAVIKQEPIIITATGYAPCALVSRQCFERELKRRRPIKACNLLSQEKHQ